LLSHGFSLGLGALSAPLVPALARLHWFRFLPHRLVRATPPAAADLIHVLGGARGGPYLRVDHGVSLFQRGLAPRLLLTGTGFRIDWAEQNSRRARQLGVPDRALLADASPGSTRAEAKVLHELARREGLRSVIVVTEAFHAERATRRFEQAVRGTGIRILSCPADLGTFPPPVWWQDLQTRSLLLGEAARLLLIRGTGDA
jgi:uncharacterized SAM-binding protein YcdF (DUF218 family)